MKFRTEIDIPKSNVKIEHKNKILTIGSCFAENIAEYFKVNRFEILANPFGVLYNPISILNSLNVVIDQKIFTEDDIFFHQSEWHSFFHHSDFSNHKKEIILSDINNGIKKTHKFLKNTDWLLITFGTSFVYKFNQTGNIVSNCHKIPQKEFTHYRLNLDETRKTILSIIELVKNFNPNIKIVFTVSPVRHWKDGANANQLSKATLLLAIDEILKFAKGTIYFPSYEIILDELRDYRFYNSDMLHPNKIATDYIWEKFTETFCSQKCFETMKEVSKINSALNHRVRNPESDEHQKFTKQILSKIELLKTKYEYLNFDSDIEYFNTQLKTDIKNP